MDYDGFELTFSGEPLVAGDTFVQLSQLFTVKSIEGGLVTPVEKPLFRFGLAGCQKVTAVDWLIERYSVND